MALLGQPGLWIGAPPSNRIARGGGSVVVNADGSITLAPAAGMNATLASGALILPLGAANAVALGFTGTTGGIYGITNGVALSSGSVQLVNADATRFLLTQPGVEFNLGGTDLRLFRDAANALAQRNGVTGQAFRVYNIYTDASNYERLFFGFVANKAYFTVQNAGTGIARDFSIRTDGPQNLSFGVLALDRWTIDGATGNFVASTDNANDIGASGANRPRDLFLARNAVIGGTLAVTGNVGFFGAAVAAKQVSGADLTNNVTAGGVNDTIANYTDLAVYANDAAAIRNDIYQLARKLAQVNNALRLYGLLT